MSNALLIPIARLESDRYSVPRGTYGMGTELEKMPGYFDMSWLPPVFCNSAPIAGEDLDFDVPSLAIEERFFAPEFKETLKKALDG